MSVSFIHIGAFKIQHTQISAVNDTDCCLKRPKRKILLSYSMSQSEASFQMCSPCWAKPRM